MTEVVVTTGAVRRAKLYSQIVTTTNPIASFLQAACPSCRTTASSTQRKDTEGNVSGYDTTKIHRETVTGRKNK